jgi:hypothetical protein
MRHVLFACTIATSTRGMIDTASTGCLVAPAGSTLGTAPGFLCASPGAIDLAPVAAAANDHLSTTARTQKKASRRRVSQFTGNGV